MMCIARNPVLMKDSCVRNSRGADHTIITNVCSRLRPEELFATLFGESLSHGVTSSNLVGILEDIVQLNPTVKRTNRHETAPPTLEKTDEQ
eukprot:4864580-Amphidinium_carterae.1